MVRVTYLGVGSRTLIIGKGSKVRFEDNVAKDLSDDAGRAAREVNKAVGHMIYHVDDVQASKPVSRKVIKAKTPKNPRQPDVLDKMDPKRTVEDAVSDRSRSLGLE